MTPQGEGWQPIETAPRDGKDRIDLFDMARGLRAPDCYFHRKAGRWMSKHYDREGFSVLRLPFQPTHWMPLPTPPTEGA